MDRNSQIKKRNPIQNYKRLQKSRFTNKNPVLNVSEDIGALSASSVASAQGVSRVCSGSCASRSALPPVSPCL